MPFYKEYHLYLYPPTGEERDIKETKLNKCWKS